MAYNNISNYLIDNIDISQVKFYDTYSNEELVQKVRLGNKIAFDVLIQRNIPLILNVAKNLSKEKNDIEELTNEGYFGFIYAIQNFNIEKRTKFSTYATKCIIGFIKSYQNKKLRGLSFPDGTMYDVSILKKTISDFQCQYGYTPSFDELASILPFSKKKIMGLYNCVKEEISLNQNISSKIHGEIQNMTIMDVLLDDYNLEDDVNNRELYSFLREIVYNGPLSKKEKEIVIYYFGFGSNIPMREIDISKLLNVSRQYVSSVLKNAFKKIKREILKNKNIYPDYINAEYKELRNRK